MKSQEDSSEKSHEPTQRKLDTAREKGDISRSPDLLTAAGYCGVILGIFFLGNHAVWWLYSSLLPFISNPEQLVAATPNAFRFSPIRDLSIYSGAAALMVFAFPFFTILSTLLATNGFTFSFEKLSPKMSRISLMENAKNKFGSKGLYEFLKGAVKLFVISGCLVAFLVIKAESYMSAAQSGGDLLSALLFKSLLDFLVLVSIISIIFGGSDFFWQRAAFIRRHRMSFKELRDEHKEQEGDPYLKQKRRAFAQEISNRNMLADVPSSDVVIVNPTHYAVALKWNRLPGVAPVCVAKGLDVVAARIRNSAQTSGVPIFSDPVTARALFGTTDIGAQIPYDFYKPVAAAFRFAETIRIRSKRGFRS